MEGPTDTTAAGERRGNPRFTTGSPIRLCLEAVELEGFAADHSRSGVRLSTEDAPRATVRFEEDGVVRELRGRLVRVQRAHDGRTDWAIEFLEPVREPSEPARGGRAGDPRR